MIVKNQRDEHSADALLYTSRNLSTVTFSASFTGVQCVRACVRVCTRARARARVCVCVQRQVSTRIKRTGRTMSVLLSFTHTFYNYYYALFRGRDEAIGPVRRSLPQPGKGSHTGGSENARQFLPLRIAKYGLSNSWNRSN